MTSRYQVILAGGVHDYQTKRDINQTDNPAEWAEYQAWLTAGGQLLPPDSITGDDLATAKAKRVADINAYAASLRNRFIAGRSAGEIGAWALKLLDAMAVAGGQPSPFAAVLPQIGTALGLPSTPTSYNDAIAKVRGITEAAHAQKVLTPALQFLVAEAMVDGVRGKHCDAVNACATVQDVLVYAWLTGWPEL